MRISQILFLMGGLSMVTPAFADDDGGDYEAAPVAFSVQEQEDDLDQYDDGDYEAAPVAWDAKKPSVKPSAQVKQPQKRATPVSNNAKQVSQQRWAKLAASEEAFE